MIFLSHFYNFFDFFWVFLFSHEADRPVQPGHRNQPEGIRYHFRFNSLFKIVDQVAVLIRSVHLDKLTSNRLRTNLF